LAYPDRVAKNRGSGGTFLLANGRGGMIDAASPLSRAPFLVVAELTGAAASGRILLAAPITLSEIEARFADKIEDSDTVTFDAASASLRARRSRRLGAIALAEQTKPVTPDADTAHIFAQGLIALGLATYERQAIVPQMTAVLDVHSATYWVIGFPLPDGASNDNVSAITTTAVVSAVSMSAGRCERIYSSG